MPIDTSTITPKKWRHYYLYALSRIITALTHYVELLERHRASDEKAKKFFDQFLEELAWTQTMHQLATATNPGIALHGGEVLRRLTYRTTNEFWNSHLGSYRTVLEDAEEEALMKMDLNACTWWKRSPYVGIFSTLDEFVIAFVKDEVAIRRLIHLDKTKARIDEAFEPILTEGEKKAKALRDKLFQCRMIAEVTLATLDQKFDEAAERMDKAKANIEAMGGHIDNCEQVRYIRAIKSGELDDDIDRAIANMC
ncbi:hypothetical protein NMY22_g10582 [Coprinellus aureogranulatus]|nr:hypothetical protein NMY22_g10582 [Coprinellus aureogranulatus]